MCPSECFPSRSDVQARFGLPSAEPCAFEPKAPCDISMANTLYGGIVPRANIRNMPTFELVNLYQKLAQSRMQKDRKLPAALRESQKLTVKLNWAEQTEAIRDIRARLDKDVRLAEQTYQAVLAQPENPKHRAVMEKVVSAAERSD